MQQTSKWQTPLPELLLEALRKHNSLSDNCYPSDVQANSYPHQGTRGGGWNPSPEFLMCCSILKRSYL